MSLDAETLRSSLDLVVSRRPQLTERFYELLFERNPQTQSMFTRNSREHQAVLLQQAIAAVVKNVEDPEWLTSNLKELGARHVECGVTQEMYGWVGECLIATLQEAAGDDWSAEIEKAWVDAYGAIATLMTSTD